MCVLKRKYASVTGYRNGVDNAEKVAVVSLCSDWLHPDELFITVWAFIDVRQWSLWHSERKWPHVMALDSSFRARTFPEVRAVVPLPFHGNWHRGEVALFGNDLIRGPFTTHVTRNRDSVLFFMEIQTESLRKLQFTSATTISKTSKDFRSVVYILLGQKRKILRFTVMMLSQVYIPVLKRNLSGA